MERDPEARVLTQEEVLEAMERDEAEGASKLSPREYALLRGKKPQIVYYYIRRGKIKMEQCICGRNVIDVEAADKFFGGEADDGDDSRK